MITRQRHLAHVLSLVLLTAAAALAQSDAPATKVAQSPPNPAPDAQSEPKPASPAQSGAPTPTEQRDRPTAPGDPSKDAQHFGSPMQLPSDETRESMWPAPTAADWQKPCLVQWQRTWDDAVKVSKATHKPIMICVNMDGEV